MPTQTNVFSHSEKREWGIERECCKFVHNKEDRVRKRCWVYGGSKLVWWERKFFLASWKLTVLFDRAVSSVVQGKSVQVSLFLLTLSVLFMLISVKLSGLNWANWLFYLEPGHSTVFEFHTFAAIICYSLDKPIYISHPGNGEWGNPL